jgi:opacity protein-like surface antigen
MKTLLAASMLLLAASAHAIPVLVFNFSQTDWTVNFSGGVAENGTAIPSTWTANGSPFNFGWTFNITMQTDDPNFPFQLGENTVIATIEGGQQFTRTFTVNNPGPRPEDTIPEGGASVALLFAGLVAVLLARHIIAASV